MELNRYIKEVTRALEVSVPQQSYPFRVDFEIKVYVDCYRSSDGQLVEKIMVGGNDTVIKFSIELH